jgi:hypothetical protein
MTMGDKGMADMGMMEMPLPENTLPMMTGEGPFGGVEMGGMFSVLKVRKDQKPGDYKDPGWYVHPKGTAAYEYQGDAAGLGEPVRPALPIMPVCTIITRQHLRKKKSRCRS